MSIFSAIFQCSSQIGISNYIQILRFRYRIRKEKVLSWKKNISLLCTFILNCFIEVTRCNSLQLKKCIYIFQPCALALSMCVCIWCRPRVSILICKGPVWLQVFHSKQSWLQTCSVVWRQSNWLNWQNQLSSCSCGIKTYSHTDLKIGHNRSNTLTLFYLSEALDTHTETAF